MIAQLIERTAKGKGALCFRNTSISWNQFLSYIIELKSNCAHMANSRVGLIAESPVTTLALLVAFSDLGSNVILLPADTSKDGLTSYPVDFIVRATGDIQIIVQDCASHGPAKSTHGGLLRILSSGTTGEPRVHTWSWSTLCEQVRVPESVRGGVWLSAYPIYTFAGIQATLYACAGAETCVLLQPTDSLSSSLRWSSSFTLAMAAPTFWRRSLLLEAKDCLQATTIGTISMGGEPVTQDLLDQLRQTFKCRRLVHVYASSEYGSLFSVSDGYAGFPSDWLDRQLNSGVALTIRENELYVSPRRGCDYLPTGDAVRVVGDRVFFEGRLTEQINVGGRKVSPLQVESALRSVLGVADARVYGLKSAVTGQLVAADLILESGYGEDYVRQSINEYFRQQLPPFERPRRIRFVDTLPTTKAGKLIRR
jgi:acyl-CoA synthetase (AMP-forming)/AMP-acid ligase II